MLTCNMLPKFRKNFLPPASRSSQQFGYPEAASIRLLQSVITNVQSTQRHIPDSSNLVTCNVHISLRSRLILMLSHGFSTHFPPKLSLLFYSGARFSFSVYISPRPVLSTVVLKTFPHRDCL